MSQVLTLYRLQQIDSQADRVRARLNIIQKSLEDDASLQQAIDQEKSTASERSSTELNQEQIETEVLNLRIKIEQTESSLYGGIVRNPKELQDLQNEAAALKRYLATLEDRLFESMEASEQALLKNEQAKSFLIALRESWDSQNQDFNQEQATLLKELQKLITERLAITGSIEKDQITLYERLRQDHRGLAVCVIQENTCLACGATLTLSQVQAARSPGQISLCPSCGRILYGN